MLLLVATNPTIDRLVTVPELHVSQVHRATALQLSAGGKAINVARAANTLGVPQHTVGFLAGFAGQHLEKLINREGLNCRWYHLSYGETKMSHLLLHENSDTTVINEPGPRMQHEDWLAFTDLIWSQAQSSRAVVLAGTIPPGVSPSEYAALCHKLASLNTQVFVDTPGRTLQAILSDPRDLAIKVNKAELAHALGIDLDAPGRMVATMRALIGTGARLIGVTLGAKGAIIANRDGIYRVTRSPHPQPLSTVGSGDSFTAGLVTGYLRSWSLPESLRLAAACGVANTESYQPASFTRERAEQLMREVEVESAY